MASKEPQLPTQEEIASLSIEAQIIYAARCALRVFPMIGSKGHFKFWGDEAKRRVESVWAAVLVAIENSKPAAKVAAFSAKATVEASSYYTTGFGRPTDAYSAAACGAEAARAVASAYDFESNANASKAAKTPYTTLITSAAYSSSVIAFDTIAAASVARRDYEFLVRSGYPKEAAWLVFRRSLFEGTSSFYDEEFLGKIEKGFRSVGCMDLLDTWRRFHDGNPPSKKEAEMWLDSWLKRYHSGESLESGFPEQNKTKTIGSGVQEIVRNIVGLSGTPSNETDNPASVDRLGRDRLINPLATMLSLPDQKTPLTIGLFGHWGSGKSTVMRLLQKKLDDNRKFKTKDKREFLFSWFNCWEYEQTENIPAGLAQEVVRGLLTDGSYQEDERHYNKEVNCFMREVIRIRYHWLENRWQTSKLIGKWLLILTAALWSVPFITEIEDLSSVLLGSSIMGTTLVFGWQLFKQGKVLWEHPLTTEMATFFKLPSYREELGQIPAIRRQLNSLCKVRLHKKKWNRFAPFRRLVVFVDDLDRCKPETIAKTFDAIRLIADIPEVIVMIGIDERVAFKAMGEAYKAYAESKTGRGKEDVARDYLGKIIQVPIRLNRPGDDDLRRYIDKLFPMEFRRIEEKAPEGVPENEEMIPDSDVSETPTKETEETRYPNQKVSILQDEIEAPDQVSEEETIEQMKETPEEVRTFFEFTRIFEFTNPRQLLRLRNSYRLLKGIFPNELMDGFASDPSQPDWESALMLMLFWLEFRTESAADRIKEWFDKGNLKTTDNKDDPNVVFRNQFYEAARKQGTGYLFGEDKQLWALEDFTMTCVLPYPKKETALKPKDAEAEASS